MKLFEFEAKSILQKYGVGVPSGKVARTPDEAARIARELDGPVMLKSQITVSGRGKAGGILLAQNTGEAREIASRLIGCNVKDIRVNSLLVEEKLDIKSQFYISIFIDRQVKSFVALASDMGGGDIEQVAQDFPEKILRMQIDPLKGLGESGVAGPVRQFNVEETDAGRLASILALLYQVALENDAELVELNPLVKTGSGKFVAADARIIVDDNAIFRHPEYAERQLVREEDTPREAEARKLKLTYVDLDGDVGIIGNGAGLVMATLDMVHLFGGKPANFLDIGGGAGVEVIKNGLVFVMSKPEVRVVLVNILGGITRCDLVAEGVVEGLKAAPAKKPVSVRMMGTNEKEGQDILRLNGIKFYPDMETAAEAAIKI